VSPKGKHFGIDVKGQQTTNAWQVTPKEDGELLYALVYVSLTEKPRICIMQSADVASHYQQARDAAKVRLGRPDKRPGLNWTVPFKWEVNCEAERWEVLPE